jgi:hypothetical protein
MPACPKCGKNFNQLLYNAHFPVCRGTAATVQQPSQPWSLPVSNPKLKNTLAYYCEGSSASLATEAACTRPLPDKQKFDRAAKTFGEKRKQGQQLPAQIKGLTLADINQMSPADFMAVIDKIWNEILVLRVGDVERRTMVDPAPGAHQGIPGHPGSFRQLGLCFRCDTRDPGSVTTYGFKRAYVLSPPADIQHTLPHRAAAGLGMPAALGMWESNKDAINEMTICVSRSMRGCTKFPNPEYSGSAHIYAIKLPADKLGFDTEAWQASGAGKLWQPGEKAFYDIDADNILGHVPINKQATTAKGELHRFQLLSSRWSYTGHQTYADVAILGPELERLYGGGGWQAVLASEDFMIPT